MALAPTYLGVAPVMRTVCENYNGREYREERTAEGIVRTQETGYYPVWSGQVVWVYLNSLAAGHGGNKWHQYVWMATAPYDPAEYGWVPTNFYLFGLGMRLPLPYSPVLLPIDENTEATPPATEATPPVIEVT